MQKAREIGYPRGRPDFRIPDFWTLDPRSKVWSEIPINGTNGISPPSRYFHGWTGTGTTVYLFGGQSFDAEGTALGPTLNDLWAFSTPSATWTQLAAGLTLDPKL